MRVLVPAFLFVVLVIFFWTGLSLDPSRIPSPLIDKPAPEFSLPELRQPDRMISNETLAGKVALLNVWATWCAACRQEHDMLLAIARSGDVPIYGLNYKDDRSAAQLLLAQLGDPYTANAFDEFGKVAIDWGVYGAPETFLIDAGGIIRYKHVGPLTPEIWKDEFLPRIRSARESG